MVTVRLYVYLHHHCETLGTIPELLESVDGGPEKGRNVYGKFPRPLGQQQAGFSGQRVVQGACVLNLAAADWLL
jgi:hypothetical protein